VEFDFRSLLLLDHVPRWGAASASDGLTVQVTWTSNITDAEGNEQVRRCMLR
jgi:hypothetical protein